jgi:hypothetical protein
MGGTGERKKEKVLKKMTRTFQNLTCKSLTYISQKLNELLVNTK